MNMKIKTISIVIAFSAVTLLSGCATYRTSSNIDVQPSSGVSSTANVQILEGAPDRKFKELGQIEVSIKKLTVFHKNPTKEQANAALIEKAKILGGDAVIRTRYESGADLTTWGYIHAIGICVAWVE